VLAVVPAQLVHLNNLSNGSNARGQQQANQSKESERLDDAMKRTEQSINSQPSCVLACMI
jgi:hypothetical protein